MIPSIPFHYPLFLFSIHPVCSISLPIGGRSLRLLVDQHTAAHQHFHDCDLNAATQIEKDYSKIRIFDGTEILNNNCHICLCPSEYIPSEARNKR